MAQATDGTGMDTLQTSNQLKQQMQHNQQELKA
jgi:hypothetical protein